MVSEKRSLSGDAIDVGGLVSHDRVVVCAQVRPTDIITPDDENIGLFLRQRYTGDRKQQ